VLISRGLATGDFKTKKILFNFDFLGIEKPLKNFQRLKFPVAEGKKNLRKILRALGTEITNF
jgi:hypothetical protein